MHVIAAMRAGRLLEVTDPNNPYQPPPDDLGLTAPHKPDLAHWVYVFIALKLLGLAIVGAVVWYAHGAPNVPGDGLELPLWGMLGWIALGAGAALGVGFRIGLARHLLVLHLVGTAALELYAFVSMMGLSAHGPFREMALDYGWLYFAMALWDLGWAALFQFSRSLRAALA